MFAECPTAPSLIRCPAGLPLKIHASTWSVAAAGRILLELSFFSILSLLFWAELCLVTREKARTELQCECEYRKLEIFQESELGYELCISRNNDSARRKGKQTAFWTRGNASALCSS